MFDDIPDFGTYDVFNYLIENMAEYAFMIVENWRLLRVLKTFD